MLTRLML